MVSLPLGFDIASSEKKRVYQLCFVFLQLKHNHTQFYNELDYIRFV